MTANIKYTKLTKLLNEAELPKTDRYIAYGLYTYKVDYKGKILKKYITKY